LSQLRQGKRQITKIEYFVFHDQLSDARFIQRSFKGHPRILADNPGVILKEKVDKLPKESLRRLKSRWIKFSSTTQD